MFLALAAVSAVLAASPIGHALAQNATTERAARVIVKYKADSPLLRERAMSAQARHALQVEALGSRVGLALRAGAGVAERAHVVFANGITSEQLAKRLEAESDIEYAVPDRRIRRVSVPNDPLYLTGPPVAGTSGGPVAGQWYLRAPADTVQSSINVEPAWDLSAGGSGVVVATIDTGVRFDHPDLQRAVFGGSLLPGYDMISDPDVANDGDGRDADPSDPGDWLTLAEVEQTGGPFYQCDTQAEPSSWHGTQTSGVIGALTNNGLGMASVGHGARILPVRVLGKCGGYDSDVIAGMMWATGLPVPGVPANPNPARVLNLSLGYDGACTGAYVDAIAQITAAGAVIVVAAGNSTGHAVGTPANCPGVIAVAGLRHVGTKVGFSDLGPEISVSAPGGNCVNIGAGDACLYPILTTSNAGLTTPTSDASGGSIYTDSFNASLGTSFSAPLVAGTVALMLSVRPALTPAQVRGLLQATARPFPTTGGGTIGTPVAQCTPPQPQGASQIDQLECYCTTLTCGAGMLDAGAAVRAAQTASSNYTGLFWAAPANSEPGWGINFAHSGDQIFATWYTYDTSGKAWWLSMLADRVLPTGNVYRGSIYVDRGPPFDSYVGSGVPTSVGNGQLAMTDVSSGSFVYTVYGILQAKALTRFDMGTGPQPTCAYSATTPNFAAATNYQDLWWVANGAESGWGVNFAHQGNSIFATWYTYDESGAPLWLSALVAWNGAAYTGMLYRSAGPTYNNYDSSKWAATVVGTAALAFADGNHATFAYTINGQDGLPVTNQSKQITRFLFAASGGTLCR
jgi:serine protease